MTTSRTSLNRLAIAAVEDYLTLNVCSASFNFLFRSPCVLFVSPVAQALEQFQRVVTLEAARGSEVGSLCKTYIESSDMFIGYRALCAVS